MTFTLLILIYLLTAIAAAMVTVGLWESVGNIPHTKARRVLLIYLTPLYFLTYFMALAWDLIVAPGRLDTLAEYKQGLEEFPGDFVAAWRQDD